MVRKSILTIAVACITLFQAVLPSHAQDNPKGYFQSLKSITDQFERIQAAMEVAFDSSTYVRSLQELRYELKKFTEAHRDREQSKYLSYALAMSIEQTYLSLVKKIRTNSDRVTQDEVNRVIDTNQQKITLLRDATKVEQEEGPKAAWVDIILSTQKEGNYTDALAYSRLARSTYGDEKEFRKLEEDIGKVLRRYEDDLAEAKELVQEKKYRDAVAILEKLRAAKPDDTEIAKMYQTTASYVKKIEKLMADAKKYEADHKLKEAYRAWEELLKYEPANEEAREKIEKYGDQLQLSTTEVITTCSACGGHGYCDVCKGSGLCLTCNGYRKCVRCRGAGYFARTCSYCVCKECGGTGFCRACEGHGVVACPSCSGAGYHRVPKTVTCSVCRGSGKARFRDAPCPACSGAGQTVVNTDTICTVCKGAKAVPCAVCGGGGRCKSCGGRGHTPNCTHCGGRGVITKACTFCNRTGLCLGCKGTGVCTACKGAGDCPECNGIGVIVTKIDEEKYISEKNHYISVVTDPRGAQVFLDGKQRGETPLEIENVGVGQHIIKIVKRGYDEYKYGMVFTKNYVAKFDIKLVSRESSSYRLVSVSKAKHSVVFRNYQEHGSDSFMISLYVDGKNEWKELGETIFGHQIAALNRETKSRYNPRLKEAQVVDVSSLVLKKSDGTETKLLMNEAMQFVVHRAKVYDESARGFVYVGEGSKIGSSVVEGITDNEVILRDKNGNTFSLSK